MSTIMLSKTIIFELNKFCMESLFRCSTQNAARKSKLCMYAHMQGWPGGAGYGLLGASQNNFKHKTVNKYVNY